MQQEYLIKKIDAGFDIVIDTRGEWSAATTTRKALDAIEHIHGKYFLFVFYRDPHMPYALNSPEFDTHYNGDFKKEIKYYPDKGQMVYFNSFGGDLKKHAISLYDSEIHNVDSYFNKLMSAVKIKSDNNIIVFFSDHGESLGEHDYYYDHGDLLYQPCLRIPLIIQGIGFTERHIYTSVRSIDIASTVISALGIKIQSHPFAGADLACTATDLDAYSETGLALLSEAYEAKKRFVEGMRGRLRSLVRGNKKIIYIPKETEIEFEWYDLYQDPQETINKINQVDSAAMKKKLLDWVALDEGNWEEKKGPIDEQTRKMLTNLGYLNPE